MNHKTVLITGCSSGFGCGLVDAFLASAWRVIASMRRAEERQSLFDDAKKRYGGQLIIAKLDVTSAADRAGIQDLIESHGLDCLVNNAGYALFGALETCSEAQLRKQYEVNLIAPLLLTRQLLPALRARQGSVINVSSLMGFMGFPFSSAYCSSKAALSMVSEALSHELADLGVRVYAVEPGGFRTDFMTNCERGELEVAVYAKLSQGFQRFQARLSQGAGNHPQPVVERIVALANKPAAKLHHPLGRDAVASRLMQKLLPDSLRAKLMGMMFKRALR